jgi:GNAT superfamily N-acetyltransferase
MIVPRYEIIENYRDNDILRHKFYDFTQTVFPGIDFTEWYNRGFWEDGYIPFSIIIDDKIVSNVSVTRMKLIIDSRRLEGIQFGTVGTIPDYRNRGLSRYLMEYVLDKIRNTAEILFLFANETVLDFYPKFGFQPYPEVFFRADSDSTKPSYAARRLDIGSVADMALIRRKLKSRIDLTRRFGAADYDFITLWHFLNIFPRNLFYIEADDVILVVTEKNGKLHVWDVIHSRPIDLGSIIPKAIQSDDVKSIIYYFPPDQLHFEYDEAVTAEDSPLFILGDFSPGPEPSKFPITAQT